MRGGLYIVEWKDKHKLVDTVCAISGKKKTLVILTGIVVIF
jgi:hypothetical protein